MVQKSTLTPEARAIEQTLERLVAGDPDAMVEVFSSTPPFFRAVVVSDKFFLNRNVTERQNLVWDYLDNDRSLAKGAMHNLMGIHAYTRSEFNSLEN